MITWQVSYDGGKTWVDWPRKPDPERDAGLAMAKVRHVSGVDSCVATLTEEEREHIHQAIDMLGIYEAEERERGNDTYAEGASATRAVLKKLFRFLPSRVKDDAAPVLQCTICGRKSWTGVENGLRCNVPQPDGSRCAGTMCAAGVVASDEARLCPACNVWVKPSTPCLPEYQRAGCINAGVGEVDRA